MTERERFLEMIAENPHDDATRLIFANWLLDQGETAEAEAVRREVTERRPMDKGDAWSMGGVHKFTELIGKIMIRVEASPSNEELDFVTNRGEQYRFYHSQSCCESVSIYDINGDLKDLVGSPLIVAEEVIQNESPEDITEQCGESQTWTFYRFATAKGFVVVRWWGQSNGHYSESVDFMRVT